MNEIKEKKSFKKKLYNFNFFKKVIGVISGLFVSMPFLALGFSYFVEALLLCIFFIFYYYIIEKILDFIYFKIKFKPEIKSNIQFYRIPKDQYSKNKEAELVCGMRKVGVPFQSPWELDYFCPIHQKPGTHSDFLHFSEYKYFLWCEKCNIDIPSFLCLAPTSREIVEMYTKRFLQMVKVIKWDAKVEFREGLKAIDILFYKLTGLNFDFKAYLDRYEYSKSKKEKKKKNGSKIINSLNNKNIK